MHHVVEPKAFFQFSQKMFWLVVWKSHLGQQPGWFRRPRHAQPTRIQFFFTPHGEAANQFKICNIQCKCSELLQASLVPPHLPKVLMLLDLWSPHSPHASSAVLMRFFFNNETFKKWRRLETTAGVNSNTTTGLAHMCDLWACCAPKGSTGLVWPVGRFSLLRVAVTTAYICSHARTLLYVSGVSPWELKSAKNS